MPFSGLPRASDMYMVHIHICKVNTHTCKIKICLWGEKKQNSKAVVCSTRVLLMMECDEMLPWVGQPVSDEAL